MPSVRTIKIKEGYNEKQPRMTTTLEEVRTTPYGSIGSRIQCNYSFDDPGFHVGTFWSQIPYYLLIELYVSQIEPAEETRRVVEK